MPNIARLMTEVKLKIPFHDVDVTGVVWHGNYWRYFEIAREALLGQFNYGYPQMKASGYLWPVVDAGIKYRAALLFDQRIKVHAEIKEYQNRLRIEYQIFDAASGKRSAYGYTVQVALTEASHELCFVSPAILLQCLGVEP